MEVRNQKTEVRMNLEMILSRCTFWRVPQESTGFWLLSSNLNKELEGMNESGVLSWVGRMIDRIFAVLGAFLFAQFPSFYSQYLHELSGHVAELNYQIYSLDQLAKGSGKTIQELIGKFLASQDSDIVLQGRFIEGILSRFSSLKEALISLESTHILAKPFLFLRYFDRAIAKDTVNQYQWTIPISIEGFIYAFLGLIAGYYLYRALTLPFIRNE